MLRVALKTALVLGLGVGVLAVAIPNLISCHRHSPETAAIGALKTIGAAQALFREADKDNDGELDYAANIAELGMAGKRHGLIDEVLASGLKQGYHFEVRRSLTQPEFRWIAYAWPANEHGTRIFVTNHQGVTHYRHVDDSERMLLINGDTCEIPKGWARIGR